MDLPEEMGQKEVSINTGAANFSSFCNALDPDPAIYTFIAQNNKNEINKPLNPSPCHAGIIAPIIALSA